MQLQRLTDGWAFKAADEETWLPARVPGTVHTDLLRNGKIPDPFYGSHERELQWIDKKDWEYRVFFDLKEEIASTNRTDIVFDGLDTYADVYLNGRLLLQADNMFRTWRADVKDLLRRENNELLVRFHSPVKVDMPKHEQLGLPLPAPNDDAELGGLGDRKISVFARKAQYHYGWDWGPRFVTSGIWRDVRLEGFSGARLNDVFIRQQEVTARHALLTAVIEAELDGTAEPAKVRVRWENGEACCKWRAQTGDAANGGIVPVELDFAVPQPKLWWCRGLGEPHLYTFRVTLEDKDGRVLAERQVRTGLRSVRLVTEPDADGQGSTFHFELNGVPVFAKGANHIPNDSFLPEVTRERYRHEIASAAAANMNMLRVWGGGIYEDDAFYDLCDETGILVWQDFMFACAIYPGDEAFLANVRQEAADNIRRLRNHPCIALWCGNNEIDSAWAHFSDHPGWGWKALFTKEQEEKLWQGYEAVFHRILPEEVAKHAPGAAYWPSSPLAEWTGDERQHATGVKPHGDVHYWNVWHSGEPFEHYDANVGRFMSEYGFQSFPEPRTVEGYAPADQMALESDVMLTHQKNKRGNALIKAYMDNYMPEPKDFRSFLLMSQALQAEGVGRAFAAHRRRKPYCMGTLYWQMNDCWPVASWSGMDYHGRWKALHYEAKRQFRDTAVSVERAEGEVRFYCINDRRAPVSGELRIRLMDCAGAEHRAWTAAVQAAPGEARLVLAMAEADILGGVPAERAVLVAALTANGEWQDEKRLYFTDGKRLPLEPVAVEVRPVEGEAHAFAVTADKFARHVRLFAEAEGIFSDNGFDLLPGETKIVRFLARSDGESAFVPASPGKVRAESLADWVKR